MNVHKNARLTPLGRERLVGLIAGGMTFVQAGAVCGCSAKTAAKWWKRFLTEGREGLHDRQLTARHDLILCATLRPMTLQSGSSPCAVSA